MFQTEKEKRKHSDIEDLSFCCGKHCGSTLRRDWGRLCKAYALERLQRGQRKCRWWRQVFSTQSWDWLAASKLTASSILSHSPHCRALMPWALLAFGLQLGVVVYLGLVGRHQHTPSGSPYLIFCFCTLCLLQALEPALCLPHTHTVLQSSSGSPAPNSAKVKY